ncbi:hypothetical protein CK203_044680 [Vitis vinifera]|uniref:Retrotransposon gag domain-containing protein n=1 Tax=Vitis vinifera TaxID=29760 RepID=A0A438H9G5_VITVI|nr:hypothetical protein CK203_044680 [Vitis vinifera]
MEAIPEDQHSQHALEENLTAYRSMRDYMHPPCMSAPSCKVPATEQLVIDHILFHFYLLFMGWNDKAKVWLNCLRPRSIRSWTDLQAKFLKKIFPTHRTNDLKRQISNFSAKENEKFYECWERYMEAINACPHLGFDTWLLVSYFYDGMSSSMKQLLEMMCGGYFMSKNPEEAMDFLSYVAEVSRGWDEPNAREVGRMNSQPNASNAKAGIYILSENIDTKAKFATMARRLEELEVTKIREVQYTQPGQAPPASLKNLEQAIVNLSKVVGDFVGDQKSINAQLSQRIDSVEMQEKGNFLLNLIRIQRARTKSEAEKEKREENKGKRKGNSTKKEDLEAKVNEKPERTSNREEMIKKHMPPPFPQALHGNGINNASEILEVLRQVKVNIPLLDMIKQVPTYAKFLKDLCTIKEG